MTVGVYGPTGLSFPSGAPAALFPVDIFLPDTTTPAPLFTDETGSVPFAGPLTSDGNANLTFFAAPGPYDLAVNGGVLRVFAKVVSAAASGGAGSFVHDQATPAAVWTVNHNLGYHPFAWVTEVDGSVSLTDVQHTSNNQLVATFPSAIAGKLEMS